MLCLSALDDTVHFLQRKILSTASNTFTHAISGIHLIFSKNIKKKQDQKRGKKKADSRNRLTVNQTLELSEIAIYPQNDFLVNKRTASPKKNQTYSTTEKHKN